MNVVVLYVFAVNAGRDNFTQRFTQTYKQHDPGFNHTLMVICNGGTPSVVQKSMFYDIPCIFTEWDNTGWDIGAYQIAVMDLKCDMVLFLGDHAYFKRALWLKRMVSAFEKHGPQLYGATGSMLPMPHIRTNGFWCRPELLRSYPFFIDTLDKRYPFEHGDNNFTLWASRSGAEPLVVYWDYVVKLKDAGSVKNGYGSGDQSQCLVFDRLTDMRQR